jgi:hypothetical protein
VYSRQCATERVNAIVLLAYGDESMDETRERVCAAAAVIGTEEGWAALESKWVHRTAGIPFHANDCDSDQGIYKERSHNENKALYRDLATMLAESGLGGFGTALDLKAQARVFPTLPAHQNYYKVAVDVMEFMKNIAKTCGDKAQITFDSRTESEFNLALVYANLLEENPEWKECLAPKICFKLSSQNPRIQVGDMFAREAMKALDNEIGPVQRKIRGSWKALRDTGRFLVYSYSNEWFSELENDLPNLIQREGFDRANYEAWLKQRNRQDNLTAYIEFFHWHREQRKAI